MKRTMTALLVLSLVASAMTLAPFKGVFGKTYDVEKGSNLDKANCLLCHEKKIGGKLNGYGLDLQKAMKADKTKKLTSDVLKAVEKLDSNKNGKSNLEDIKAGALPG